MQVEIRDIRGGESLQELVDMGFARDQAKQALANARGSKVSAIEILLRPKITNSLEAASLET